MKKTVMILILFALPMMSAYAQFADPGAQTGANVITVKQLLDSGYDDQRIVIRGRLVQQVNHKNYQFADETGQILVNIHPRRWPAGLVVNDKDIVEITGKFDKDWASSKVKGYWIKKVQ